MGEVGAARFPAPHFPGLLLFCHWPRGASRRWASQDVSLGDTGALAFLLFLLEREGGQWPEPTVALALAGRPGPTPPALRVSVPGGGPASYSHPRRLLCGQATGGLGDPAAHSCPLASALS